MLMVLQCLLTWKGQHKNEAFIPKNTLTAVKHGGGCTLLWRCFASALYNVDGIIKKEGFLSIMQLHLKSKALWLKPLDVSTRELS